MFHCYSLLMFNVNSHIKHVKHLSHWKKKYHNLFTLHLISCWLSDERNSNLYKCNNNLLLCSTLCDIMCLRKSVWPSLVKGNSRDAINTVNLFYTTFIENAERIFVNNKDHKKQYMNTAMGWQNVVVPMHHLICLFGCSGDHIFGCCPKARVSAASPPCLVFTHRVLCRSDSYTTSLILHICMYFLIMYHQLNIPFRYRVDWGMYYMCAYKYQGFTNCSIDTIWPWCVECAIDL